MSPMSTPTSFSPAPTLGGSQHPAGAGYQPGLPFWAILFGVILIGLVWGLWKWKSKLGASAGPLSTPKPPTRYAGQTVRNRGPPVLGRPLAILRATIPAPPPPAYVYPPRYESTPAPHSGGDRPS